jgi:hypothetical protein
VTGSGKLRRGSMVATTVGYGPGTLHRPPAIRFLANPAPCQLPPLKDATACVRCGGFLRMHCCGQHLLSPYPPRTSDLKHDRLTGAHGSTLMPLL